MKHVWLDGDVLVYRAGYAAEHTFRRISYTFEGTTVSRRFDSKKAALEFLDEVGLDPTSVKWDVEVETEHEDNAIFNARSMIRNICKQAGTDETNLTVCLSGPSNFRNGIAVTAGYKENRDPTKKPVHAAAIKAMLRRCYNTLTSENEEADDVMAYRHYALYRMDTDSSVLATIDKDLNMIPGWHLNFGQTDAEGRYNMYEVHPTEARRFFWKQMLTGDATDNIKGVRGIGPVTADKILAAAPTETELELMVWAYYHDAFGTSAAARLLENGRLLWIRRYPDEWWQIPPTLQEKIDALYHKTGPEPVAGPATESASGGGAELPDHDAVSGLPAAEAVVL